MSKSWKPLPPEVMRKMVLDGELAHDNLAENDYKLLLEYEYFLGDPNNDVLEFCLQGLRRFPYYRDNAAIPMIKADKKGKNIFIKITVAALILLISTQFIGLAFGVNFLSYFFNWNNNDTAIVERIEELPLFEHDIIIYDNYSQMPNEIIALIPQALQEKFAFKEAIYRSQDNRVTIIFTFVHDGKNFDFIMRNTDSAYIEKNDEGVIYNEYVSGIEVIYFSNMDDYQAIWQRDGLLYQIDTAMNFDELKILVKDILES